jgi:hypothetical protein
MVTRREQLSSDPDNIDAKETRRGQFTIQEASSDPDE